MPDTTAQRAFLSGAAVLGVALLLLMLTNQLALGDAAWLLVRSAHVFAAMVWVGLIWFVNVIQLAVLAQADAPTASAIRTWIVPRVAKEFKLAANITALTGIVLLVGLGYLSGRPLAQSAWMWAGVAGAIAMLAFVHAKIAPALAIVLNPAIQDAAVKAKASNTVRYYARANMALALPVTVLMLAAAHV